jgi:hypothetical protein
MSRFDLLAVLTLKLLASAGFALIVIEIMALLAPERLPL